MEHKTDGTIGASRFLADLLTNITYESLGGDVIQRAKHHVLDQVGCLLTGSTLPWTRQIADYFESRGGVEESRVVNSTRRLPASSAAMVNSVFGHGCEWDDVTNKGWGHPGSVTVPAGLAVAEPQHSNGKDFIVAMVAGIEAMARIGKAVRPGSFVGNFHVHSILAPFGSVASAGRLLGLDAEQMLMAIGIAASCSSGITEYDQTGGEVKRLHSGLGARAGVDSAYLSLHGLTAPPTSLEGRRGFINAFSDEPHPEEITAPLEEYSLFGTSYKLYPCTATVVTSIEAAQAIMAEGGFTADDIESIDVDINDASKVHGGSINRPTDVLSAQFSLPFSVAIRLALGSNDLAHYMNESLWRDPKIQELCDKVHSRAVPEAVGELRHACDMTITLKSGETRHAYVPHRIGTFSNPISENQLVDKFRSTAGRAIDEKAVEQLIEIIFNLEQLGDINELTSLLVPAR